MSGRKRSAYVAVLFAQRAQSALCHPIQKGLPECPQQHRTLTLAVEDQLTAVEGGGGGLKLS